MGRADNRRTPKMKRRRRQAKFKARAKKKMNPLRLTGDKDKAAK